MAESAFIIIYSTKDYNLEIIKMQKYNINAKLQFTANFEMQSISSITIIIIMITMFYLYKTLIYIHNFSFQSEMEGQDGTTTRRKRKQDKPNIMDPRSESRKNFTKINIVDPRPKLAELPIKAAKEIQRKPRNRKSRGRKGNTYSREHKQQANNPTGQTTQWGF